MRDKCYPCFRAMQNGRAKPSTRYSPHPLTPVQVIVANLPCAPATTTIFYEVCFVSMSRRPFCLLPETSHSLISLISSLNHSNLFAMWVWCKCILLSFVLSCISCIVSIFGCQKAKPVLMMILIIHDVLFVSFFSLQWVTTCRPHCVFKVQLKAQTRLF